MYFLTYESNGTESIGLLTEDKMKVIPLPAAERHYFGQSTLPSTMLALVQGGEPLLQQVRQVAEKVKNDAACPTLLPLASVRLKAPIPHPPKNIFCLGRNYEEHAMERDRTLDKKEAVPQYPIIFTKPWTAIIASGEPILNHSQITKALDYEVELTVVIGKQASYVSKDKAMDYIFGYTIMNDISARDLQRQHNQWFRGKALDTSAPMGPYLVHKSAVADPHNLEISTRVNGELRQNATTKEMIFDIPTIINTISSGITLEPGDMIATGTPGGVGVYFNPPKLLKPGDQLELTITGLGTLKNTVA